MGKRSSMKSNLTMTSDSTPESDSVRTSLADISHGGGSRASRRRSGSRASHGSRGKTLRLNIEQKLGISNKGGIRSTISKKLISGLNVAQLGHFKT